MAFVDDPGTYLQKTSLTFYFLEDLKDILRNCSSWWCEKYCKVSAYLLF